MLWKTANCKSFVIWGRSKQEALNDWRHRFRDWVQNKSKMRYSICILRRPRGVYPWHPHMSQLLLHKPTVLSLSTKEALFWLANLEARKNKIASCTSLGAGLKRAWWQTHTDKHAKPHMDTVRREKRQRDIHKAQWPALLHTETNSDLSKGRFFMNHILDKQSVLVLGGINSNNILHSLWLEVYCVVLRST